VSCSGDPVDRQIPFAVLAPLVGPVPPASSVPGAQLYRVQEALIGRVETMATESPLLLTVDDLHWADEPSLAALTALARRVPDLPVAMVLAARPTPPLPVAIEERLLERCAAVLEPSPLDDEEIEQLVVEELGGRPDDAFRKLLAGANGNPFLVVELIRTLAEEQAIERDDGEVRS